MIPETRYIISSTFIINFVVLLTITLLITLLNTTILITSSSPRFTLVEVSTHVIMALGFPHGLLEAERVIITFTDQMLLDLER